MRLLLFADVEGNAWACEAILDAAKRLRDVEVVALGNVVGWGPQPHETVDLLRRKRVTLLAGPKDLAALGKAPRPAFQAEGDANASRMKPSDLAYLRSGAPARRLAADGWRLLLSAEPDPRPGDVDLVALPGSPARLDARAGVPHAFAGQAGNPTGEAPYLLVDTEARRVEVRHAAWDADALRAAVRTRHL